MTKNIGLYPAINEIGRSRQAKFWAVLVIPLHSPDGVPAVLTNIKFCRNFQPLLIDYVRPITGPIYILDNVSIRVIFIRSLEGNFNSYVSWENTNEGL